MGRAVSGTCVTALALAALLGGCGGEHRSKPSTVTTTGERQTTASAPAQSATSAAGNPGAPPAGAYWPYQKLIGSLAGRTLVLPRGSVRLDGALLECNGEGRPAASGRTREWSRYTCTQTLFQGGADRDVTFAVAIQDASDLRIISPHYGSQ